MTDVTRDKMSHNHRKITRIIRPMITKTTETVFFSYAGEIIKNGMEYIIPAIWGDRREQELDYVQEVIYAKVQSTVIKAIDALDIRSMDNEQRFCVEFLIRELLVYRLVALRAMFLESLMPENPLLLVEAEPAGCA